MRMIFVVLVFVASCGGSDDSEVTARETPCERLRDHLVDLQLADAPHIDREAHRVTLKQSLGTDFLATCSKLDRAEIDCALDAPDATTASACATRPPRADR